mgnify:FL=1
MANTIVNAIGDTCPIPVIKANKALKEMEEPGVLEIHVDNEMAVQNLKRLASSKGLASSSEQLEDKHFAVTFQVTSLPKDALEDEAPPCAEDVHRNTVVAISSAAMGRGDDELGRTLMKGFLYALTQLEELPRTILFYNGGAALSTEGSESLEDLRHMEAQGVEILTCGTCLNFYDLSDKLAVGKVTNMYTIVEKLNAAAKIIQP